jgi:hypothetical protein
MARQPGPGRPKGYPKTGGRKKGTANKLLKMSQIEKAALTGLMPLDYMLGLMRDPDTPDPVRREMARAAAPYLHSRLEAVDPNQRPNDPYAGKSVQELNELFIEALTRRGLKLVPITEDELEPPTGISPPRGSDGSGGSQY